MDRLGRSTANMLSLAAELRGRGINLNVLNLGGGTVDTATPMGGMTFTVMAALAQMELDIRRERITDSVSKRRAAGRDLGGRRAQFTDSQVRNARRLNTSNPRIWAAGDVADRQANEADVRCECRVLPLEYVPRALVNRYTQGFIKIAEADTRRIMEFTAVAKDAGELAAARVYILEAGVTVDQVANLWCPYLTMVEGFKIAAQSHTTDISKLSCCASWNSPLMASKVGA